MTPFVQGGVFATLGRPVTVAYEALQLLARGLFLLAIGLAIVCAVIIAMALPAAAQEAAPLLDEGIWERLEGSVSGTVFLIILVAYKVAQLAGKLIPDDAGGLLMWVRRAAKLISVYVPNRPSGKKSTGGA